MFSSPEAASPSHQLQFSLDETLTRTLSTRRPILHHLNADSSWLLQIPRPPSATQRGGRIYYSILIDPWLTGPQSDVASWFSTQSHAVESAVASIKEVEDLIWSIEAAAGSRVEREGTAIDVVSVCHEFTDHCHRETLEQIAQDVPIFATDKAASLIRSWNHFRTVIDVPPFSGEGTDWKSTSMPPLPEYIGISRIVAESDAFYYHSALMFTFDTHQKLSRKPKRRSNGYYDEDMEGPDAVAECVVYTPHGITPATLLPVQRANPPLKTLCFIHGLHDVSIYPGQQLNLGVHNGLQAQSMLKSKYWVGTHDEIKTGGGLVKWFLRRKVLSLEEALKEEEKRVDEIHEEKNGVKIEDVCFEEVGNGESRVLE